MPIRPCDSVTLPEPTRTFRVQSSVLRNPRLFLSFERPNRDDPTQIPLASAWPIVARWRTRVTLSQYQRLGLFAQTPPQTISSSDYQELITYVQSQEIPDHLIEVLTHVTKNKALPHILDTGCLSPKTQTGTSGHALPLDDRRGDKKTVSLAPNTFFLNLEDEAPYFIFDFEKLKIRLPHHPWMFKICDLSLMGINFMIANRWKIIRLEIDRQTQPGSIIYAIYTADMNCLATSCVPTKKHFCSNINEIEKMLLTFVFEIIAYIQHNTELQQEMFAYFQSAREQGTLIEELVPIAREIMARSELALQANLPLSFDDTDAICFGGGRRRLLAIAEVMRIIETEDTEAFRELCANFQLLQQSCWFVQEIRRHANKSGKHQIENSLSIQCAPAILHASSRQQFLEEERRFWPDTPINSLPSLHLITLLARMIYKSPHVYADIGTIESILAVIIKTRIYNNCRGDDGTHHANAAALQIALGNPTYFQADGHDFYLHQANNLEQVVILMDDQPHDLHTLNGHTSLASPLELINHLASRVIEDFLLSAQNWRYFCEHGQEHPRTGGTASRGGWRCTKKSMRDTQDRLDGYLDLRVEVINPQRLQITVVPTEDQNPEALIEQMHDDLCQRFNLSQRNFTVSEHEGNGIITINCDVMAFIQEMHDKKSNNMGIVAFDRNGNVLMAERQDRWSRAGPLGLATPGGNNGDCWHPKTAKEAEEFGMENINPERIDVIRDGDTAILICPADSYTLKTRNRDDDDDELQFELEIDQRHFFIDETEFRHGSQRAVPFETLRTEKPLLRDINTFDVYLRYVQEKLQKTITDHCPAADASVSINTEYSYVRERNLHYRKPENDFGIITVNANSPESLSAILTLLGINRDDPLLIASEESFCYRGNPQRLLDHLNPPLEPRVDHSEAQQRLAM